MYMSLSLTSLSRPVFLLSKTTFLRTQVDPWSRSFSILYLCVCRCVVRYALRCCLCVSFVWPPWRLSVVLCVRPWVGNFLLGDKVIKEKFTTPGGGRRGTRSVRRTTFSYSSPSPSPSSSPTSSTYSHHLEFSHLPHELELSPIYLVLRSVCVYPLAALRVSLRVRIVGRELELGWRMF